MNGRDLGWYTGGMCANFAVAARQVGTRADFVTVFGEDQESVVTRDSLHRLGVGTAGSLTVRDGKSWWSVTLLDERGEKALVVVESGLPLPPVEAVTVLPLDSWQLVYPLTIDTQWSGQIGAAAKAAGCLVIFDIEINQVDGQWGTPAFTEMLGTGDIVFVKRAACERAGFRDVREAVASFFEAGPSIVVITDGSGDIYCATSSGDAYTVTPPAVRAVDSTGAGDAFAGAFCGCYVQGGTIESSLVEATAVGAMSVTFLGCQAYAPVDHASLAELRQRVTVTSVR